MCSATRRPIENRSFVLCFIFEWVAIGGFVVWHFLRLGAFTFFVPTAFSSAVVWSFSCLNPFLAQTSFRHYSMRVPRNLALKRGIIVFLNCGIFPLPTLCMLPLPLILLIFDLFFRTVVFTVTFDKRFHNSGGFPQVRVLHAPCCLCLAEGFICAASGFLTIVSR